MKMSFRQRWVIKFVRIEKNLMSWGQIGSSRVVIDVCSFMQFFVITYAKVVEINLESTTACLIAQV